ncbi:MAG TPA: hypothetical protein VJ972_13880 [Anaerolineales bacterium]|nr:hypothetical protein [Anaerolineales bacterium]
MTTDTVGDTPMPPLAGQLYIYLMSETYQSKRERWQRLRETLPENLREHVSLRNVEAVASLTAQAQKRLTEAIGSGLKRLPRAIEQLKIDPDTSVEDLLNPPSKTNVKTLTASSEIPPLIQKELADMIQLCFPEMTRISAESLVEADVMEITWRTLQAHHQVFESSHLKTDFVLVIQYGLMRQSLERLEKIIQETPALRQAITQSPLPWKPNERRKQNA